MKRPRGFTPPKDVPSTLGREEPEIDLAETVDLQPSLLKNARKEVRKAQRELRKAKRQRRKKDRQEKRRFTAFNRARRIKLVSISAAILGLALFVAVGVFTPVMSVRTIEIEGSQRISKEELKLALEPIMGKPIALVDEEEVKDILREYKLIEKYTILLVPPETLSVVIVERTPALAVARGENFELVDAAGVVTASVKQEEKPENIPIAMKKSADVGSAEFRASARVALMLDEDLRNKVKEVEAKTPFSVTLFFDEGYSVLWGDTSEGSYKNIVLKSILEAVGDKPIKMIDISSPKSPVFQ